MGVMARIAGLGKYVGKGDVRCVDCKVLDTNAMCYGVQMTNIEEPRSCLFYRAK